MKPIEFNDALKHLRSLRRTQKRKKDYSYEDSHSYQQAVIAINDIDEKIDCLNRAKLIIRQLERGQG